MLPNNLPGKVPFAFLPLRDENTASPIDLSLPHSFRFTLNLVILNCPSSVPPCLIIYDECVYLLTTASDHVSFLSETAAHICLLTDRGWPHSQAPTLPLPSVTRPPPVSSHIPAFLQVPYRCSSISPGSSWTPVREGECPQPVHIRGILSRSLLEALSLCPLTGLTSSGSCCVNVAFEHGNKYPGRIHGKGKNIYLHARFLRLPSIVTWPISLVLWWQSVLWGLDM